MTNKNTTRYYSSKQENNIANNIGGKIVPNSGSSKFCAGDVQTKDFLIEAKTCMKNQESFSIKKSWIVKNELERMSLNKPFSALAFSFGPDSPNYYVINENIFKKLINFLENSE